MGSIADLLAAAVAQGVTPSASLVASRAGGPALEVHRGAGASDLRYDVASLTKVLYTAAAAKALVADGALEWGAIADLLLHESGLPWWRPLYEEVGAPAALPVDPGHRDEVRRRVRALPLEAPPGAAAVYSDPGFIRLEEILEDAASEALPAYVRRRLWEPWGLASVGFVDLTRPGAPEHARSRAAYAPTEDCPRRGRRMHAEVHDDNAHAMGGISGHAGLFATAGDVHRFGVALLRCLRGDDPALPAQVVNAAWTTRGRAPGSTRVLGWDTPTPGASSVGRHASSGAVGHLGFTGCSLWVDPDPGIVVALLTNRVYFGREDLRIRRLRPAVHDAVFEVLLS